MFFTGLWSSWPPIPGLLESKYSFVLSKPQSEWTIDDWRHYSEFLLMHGQSMFDELQKTSAELVLAKAKASRSKAPKKPKPVRGLLSILNEPSAKKGRKPGSGSSRIAMRVIEKQDKAKANGGKMSATKALTQVLIDDGLSEWRAKAEVKNKRHIINEVSKLRNSQK